MLKEESVWVVGQSLEGTPKARGLFIVSNKGIQNRSIIQIVIIRTTEVFQWLLPDMLIFNRIVNKFWISIEPKY